MLRTLTTPWTGYASADRKNWPGGHFSSPPAWARWVSVLVALYRVPTRFALRNAQRALAGAASSQQLLAVGASPWSAEAHSAKADCKIKSRQQRLAVAPPCGRQKRTRLGPIARSRAGNSFWLLPPPRGRQKRARCLADFRVCPASPCAQPSAGLAGRYTLNLDCERQGRAKLRIAIVQPLADLARATFCGPNLGMAASRQRIGCALRVGCAPCPGSFLARVSNRKLSARSALYFRFGTR
nr:Hypothetical protein Drgb7_00050 [uncultured bacterium]